MSVQSESGRVDYHKSDHAPKGQRMAGDVVKGPTSGLSSLAGAIGQDLNVQSLKGGVDKIDPTNLGSMPDLLERYESVKKNK